MHYIKAALNEVKGTSDKLAMLDRTATAADDIANILPKSVTPAEKELHQFDRKSS